MPVQFGSSGGILSTTWANKPASYPVGSPVFITNAGADGSHWYYDGTRYKPLNGRALLASLDTASGNITNSGESLVFQYLIPANVVQLLDRLNLRCTMTKSGTTDTGTLRVRVGTAGTTADTLIFSGSGMLGAAQQTAAFEADFRLATATTLQALANSGSTSATFGYSNQSNNAAAAAPTISNVSNALYFSVGILSGGATNTVALTDARLWLDVRAN